MISWLSFKDFTITSKVKLGLSFEYPDADISSRYLYLRSSVD